MPKTANLLIVLALVASSALAAMLFGSDGAVPEGRSTTRSAIQAFGESVTIDRPVRGNVQVIGGDIDVRHPIDGDLLVVNGNVTIRDAGRISGSLIAFGASISGAEGRVGKIYTPKHVDAALEMVIGADRSSSLLSLVSAAVKLSLLFCWLVAGVILTMTSSREIRAASVEVRASALHCFTVGLVALTSLVLTAIAFSYLVPYVVGIPLLAALALFALMTKIFGMVAVLHAVGSLIARPRRVADLNARRWFRGDLALVILGLIVLGGIRLFPVVGTIVWALASVFGVGVALATKFGRREPWFLAWQTVEA